LIIFSSNNITFSQIHFNWKEIDDNSNGKKASIGREYLENTNVILI